MCRKNTQPTGSGRLCRGWREGYPNTHSCSVPKAALNLPAQHPASSLQRESLIPFVTTVSRSASTTRRTLLKDGTPDPSLALQNKPSGKLYVLLPQSLRNPECKAHKYLDRLESYSPVTSLPRKNSDFSLSVSKNSVSAESQHWFDWPVTATQNLTVL